MSFVEWYNANHKDDWHEEYAGMYMFAGDMADEYETYCEKQSIRPVWDG